MSKPKTTWEEYLIRFGAMEQATLANREDIVQIRNDVDSLKITRARIIGIAAGVSTVVSGIAGLIMFIWS